MCQGSRSWATWSAPAPGGLSPLSYDFLRSETPGSFAAAVCLESDESNLTAMDTTTPSSIYYYLVRSQNICGGNLGTDSSGNPRAGVACP